ncbi:TIGR03067 domain-containing protein [Stieleria marina]|uniref:Uncharacterized protein n=1 Tax=Stieleria marina TaxID=1930275 RepID=A0A517NXT9_9BACT|nr:hypothetical protein K239x_39460 [Planctomycetes bacterium K23_9]
MNNQAITTVMFIVLAAVATVAVSKEPTESNAVLKLLQGVWEIEEGVNQGKELLEDALKGTTPVVKGKTIVTYDRDQKETYRASFTLDVTKEPVLINMVTQMKQFPDAKAFGILKFEGDDEFSLAYGLPGTPRPTKFKSPVGGKVMLFELEKEDRFDRHDIVHEHNTAVASCHHAV